MADLPVSSYCFPSDLMESPEYGAMIQFTAYTPQSFAQAAAARAGLTSGRKMLDNFWLYMPGGGQSNNLSFQQGHEYDEIKLARLGAGVASAVIGVGSDLIQGGNALAGGLFRRQINPGVEVLYRGTSLRRYNFSFTFAPQSKPDADMLYGTSTGDGILNRFRYYAAPEITGITNYDSLQFKSPSEWEISFWTKAAGGSWTENTKIPKVTKGAFVRVDVDYNPETEFSTFEDGGAVTSRLTMEFVEMQIVDKTLISQGY
jgi:hypothetical protein